MPQLEVKHLKLIQAITETENLTRAAARLMISQPALSRQLLDIEDRLGTSLFHRSRKRMLLYLGGLPAYRQKFIDLMVKQNLP